MRLLQNIPEGTSYYNDLAKRTFAFLSGQQSNIMQAIFQCDLSPSIHGYNKVNGKCITSLKGLFNVLLSKDGESMVSEEQMTKRQNSIR